MVRKQNHERGLSFVSHISLSDLTDLSTLAMQVLLSNDPRLDFEIKGDQVKERGIRTRSRTRHGEQSEMEQNGLVLMCPRGARPGVVAYQVTDTKQR